MATYKDGLKNLLSSDRFTSRATPFRLAMMERIRDRARRNETVLVPNRFQRPYLKRQFCAAEGDERLRLGRILFEAWRFRFFRREVSETRPRLRRNWHGYAGHTYTSWNKVPEYRSGIEKRKKKQDRPRLNSGNRRY